MTRKFPTISNIKYFLLQPRLAFIGGFILFYLGTIKTLLWRKSSDKTSVIPATKTDYCRDYRKVYITTRNVPEFVRSMFSVNDLLSLEVWKRQFDRFRMLRLNIRIGDIVVFSGNSGRVDWTININNANPSNSFQSQIHLCISFRKLNLHLSF